MNVQDRYIDATNTPITDIKAVPDKAREEMCDRTGSMVAAISCY